MVNRIRGELLTWSGDPAPKQAAEESPPVPQEPPAEQAPDGGDLEAAGVMLQNRVSWPSRQVFPGKLPTYATLVNICSSCLAECGRLRGLGNRCSSCHVRSDRASSSKS